LILQLPLDILEGYCVALWYKMLKKKETGDYFRTGKQLKRPGVEDSIHGAAMGSIGRQSTRKD